MGTLYSTEFVSSSTLPPGSFLGGPPPGFIWVVRDIIVAATGLPPVGLFESWSIVTTPGDGLLGDGYHITWPNDPSPELWSDRIPDLRQVMVNGESMFLTYQASAPPYVRVSGYQLSAP